MNCERMGMWDVVILIQIRIQTHFNGYIKHVFTICLNCNIASSFYDCMRLQLVFRLSITVYLLSTACVILNQLGTRGTSPCISYS